MVFQTYVLKKAKQKLFCCLHFFHLTNFLLQFIKTAPALFRPEACLQNGTKTLLNSQLGCNFKNGLIKIGVIYFFFQFPDRMECNQYSRLRNKQLCASIDYDVLLVYYLFIYISQIQTNFCKGFEPIVDYRLFFQTPNHRKAQKGGF